MKTEQAFGIVLHKHRTNLQLSQEEVAFQSGLDRTYISLLERGKRKPTINTLFSLASTLKVKPAQLIKEVEECLNYQ
ncbi:MULTISPECIES: helix-turn-helix domain-containing protein [Bacillus cereus group]|uniref:helix-turn-helix domain-containing protein n=1 Tax=Bacillus cereus group TaxID=86661 RepID=UPI0008C4D198|nr:MULTISPECIES: helix-turn-helix transcriptional regulator [Bacillus cereus group]MDF2084654.1 helix-turn-helix transcriptional regulator [Bacillus pseudomycoides]PEM52047.1 XRE family transcriptional regulator [Bacillus wiedmannii]SEJ69479.1 Helix-turn-helix [Bacillus thuringiensis]